MFVETVPDMQPPRRIRGVLRVMLAICIAGICGCGVPAGSTSGRNQPASSIDAFFSSYVGSDGRVVRHDQGGDTVGEGQAYAMLLAVANNDQGAFNRVWSWTRTNLQHPDGLLAWHWAGGRVVDTNPAADADVDAAWALTLAGQQFSNSADMLAARRLSKAILDLETAPDASGLVLVAGTWARSDPATVDPSYFSPLAFSALYAATSDQRWNELAASARSVIGQLTSQPDRLPPDWAHVSPAGTATAAPAPNGPPPGFGLDAARVEVWYPAACTNANKGLSAQAWPLLEPTATTGRYAISMSLSGVPQSADSNPLMAVADAAVAAAAGKSSQAASLLSSAQALDEKQPTYYGSAWTALGEILLTTNRLQSCPLI